MESDRIAWFNQPTKRGKGSNWLGMSSGAEGDMLSDQVKDTGFFMSQIIMDPTPLQMSLFALTFQI